jgi:hypothetical protein
MGLKNELLARRHHYNSREVRNSHCWSLVRGHRSPIVFEIWTRGGAWFWNVVDPQRNGGTIGAAATETEAIREARSSIEKMSARQARVATCSSLAMPRRSWDPI